MSVLREVRKAVFGETWELPVGVAVLVGGAAVLREVAGGAWPDFGGPFLVSGAIALLSILVFRGARGS